MLVGYLGLDPRVRQSGTSAAVHGHISKRGSAPVRHTRRVLVEQNTALFTAGEEEVTISAGDFMVVSANKPHRYVGANEPVPVVSVHPRGKGRADKPQRTGFAVAVVGRVS